MEETVDVLCIQDVRDSVKLCDDKRCDLSHSLRTAEPIFSPADNCEDTEGNDNLHFFNKEDSQLNDKKEKPTFEAKSSSFSSEQSMSRRKQQPSISSQFSGENYHPSFETMPINKKLSTTLQESVRNEAISNGNSRSGHHGNPRDGATANDSSRSASRGWNSVNGSSHSHLKDRAATGSVSTIKAAQKLTVSGDPLRYAEEIPVIKYGKYLCYGDEIPALSEYGRSLRLSGYGRSACYGDEIPSLSSSWNCISNGDKIPSLSSYRHRDEKPRLNRLCYGDEIPSLSTQRNYGRELTPNQGKHHRDKALLYSEYRCSCDEIPSLSTPCILHAPKKSSPKDAELDHSHYSDEIPSLSKNNQFASKARNNQNQAVHRPSNGLANRNANVRSANRGGHKSSTWVESSYPNSKPFSKDFGGRYHHGTDNGHGWKQNKTSDTLARGPRANREKNSAPGSSGKDGEGSNSSFGCGIMDDYPQRDQYNKSDFVTQYEQAKFFLIKSYSEDDIHKSIKYNVWASTPNGNTKLNEAYSEAQSIAKEKGSKCPIFLFFSVNSSGQFVGLAGMTGPLDVLKTMDFWHLDKWSGFFPLQWHIIKDIPNRLFRHITLENNYNRPVTFSRDTQEILLPQGLEMLEIFKAYQSETCILDDYEFYEEMQRSSEMKRKSNPLHYDLDCDDGFDSSGYLEEGVDRLSFY